MWYLEMADWDGSMRRLRIGKGVEAGCRSRSP